MKTLAQQKASFDTHLKKWKSRLNTLDRSLEEKTIATGERLNERKEKLLSTMEKIDGKIDNLPDIAEEKKNKILEKRDVLKVQLALKKAEIKSNYKENTKLFNDAIRDYEEQLESDLEIEDALLEKEWIEDSIEYEEEMNALGIEMVKEDNEMAAEFEKKKNELKASLQSFKLKVEKKNKKFKDGLEESFEDLNEHYAELGQYYYMY